MSAPPDAKKIAAAKQRREFEQAIDRDERLTAATRLIAGEMLRWVNSVTGYAWPAAKKIAGKLGLCERTVRAGMGDLETYGYFRAERRPGQTTRWQPLQELPRVPTPAKNAGVIAGVIAGVTPEVSAGNPGKKRLATPAKNADISQSIRSRAEISGRSVNNTGDISLSVADQASTALRAPAPGANEAAIAALAGKLVLALQRLGEPPAEARDLAARWITTARSRFAEGRVAAAIDNLLTRNPSHDGRRRRETLRRWLTRAEADPSWWPSARPDMRRADAERVALPFSGRRSQRIIALLADAPDHAIAYSVLQAVIGSQIGRAIYTLRGCGLLEPADPSRRAPVKLSADALTTMARGEIIRDRRGAVLWLPPALRQAPGAA